MGIPQSFTREHAHFEHLTSFYRDGFGFTINMSQHHYTEITLVMLVIVSEPNITFYYQEKLSQVGSYRFNH